MNNSAAIHVHGIGAAPNDNPALRVIILASDLAIPAKRLIPRHALN